MKRMFKKSQKVSKNKKFWPKFPAPFKKKFKNYVMLTYQVFLNLIFSLSIWENIYI